MSAPISDEVLDAYRNSDDPAVRALIDDLERTRRGARTLGEVVEAQGRMILDITGLHDWIDEDGDGDWGAVWDNAYELLPRLKAAETRETLALEHAEAWKARALRAEAIMQGRA